MICKNVIISKLQLLMLSISSWHTRERLFCLTFARLERMKHVKVFGGRLQCPSPFPNRWLPRREGGEMLSQTREKSAFFLNLCGIRPTYSCILPYAELERKDTYGRTFFSKVGIISNFWPSISSPQHFFHCHTSKRLTYCRTTAMSLLFDTKFHG